MAIVIVFVLPWALCVSLFYVSYGLVCKVAGRDNTLGLKDRLSELFNINEYKAP
jgi:hypothetical protein